MRKAIVYYKDEEAAELIQLSDGTFEFTYTSVWLDHKDKPAISLTLPKRIEVYRSEFLFPFFYNMLPEGVNKDNICFHKRIDKSDHFGLLLKSASNDTIGAVRIEKKK
jgi:serine/threonine-protein kinase HipA